MGIYATSNELVDAGLREYIDQLDVNQANAVVEVYHRTITRQNQVELELVRLPWTAERATTLEQIRKENLQTRQEADYAAEHYMRVLRASAAAAK